MATVDSAIILAGGAGTRLWPASRAAHPKQFMDPGIGMTLLTATLHRAARLVDGGPIVVVTHADHVEPLLTLCGRLDSTVRDSVIVLAEPHARNTAPAIALAVGYLNANVESGRGVGDAAERVSLVLAADHIIEPVEALRADVEAAAELSRSGYIATFGVVPTAAETGFGYIEAGEPNGRGRTVVSFREKPDRDTARKYLSAGNYFWNSGMFAFSHASFAAELTRHEPAISSALLTNAPQCVRQPGTVVPVYSLGAAEARQYGELSKISVDYAVMERAERVAMVPASFAWSDLGSWDEVAALAERRRSDNTLHSAALPHVVELESNGNYVDSDLPVALCRVDDLIVVAKDGAILICRKGGSQLVREAVEEFRRRGNDSVL